MVPFKLDYSLWMSLHLTLVTYGYIDPSSKMSN